MDSIYQKAQDYINWLSVLPASWKEPLGDFMDVDMDETTVQETLMSPEEPSSSETVCVVEGQT